MTLKAVLALLVASALSAATPTLAIKVDQVGYLPSRPKIAFVAGRSSATGFTVIRASDSSTVYQGKLSTPVDDPDTGDRVQVADFSAVNAPGSYFLDVPGVGRSWPFAIGQDVYRRALYLAARAFYGQRCGIAVDLGPEFPGYKHAACHLAGAYHASSGRTGAAPSSGGWHDAGDYGRYVVNSGISTGTLLWTWEMFGKQLGPINLHIPESGNGAPDFLNEARWNLAWMLSLQDSDGGVWQKQTSDHFCAFIMPEKDTLVSDIIGTGSAPFKSSCATADLAAVAAIAARVFQPYDAAFARKSLEAATRAWKWLDANPNVTFRNPPGITTGDYGNGDCSDKRLWAAAELARTTNDAAYTRYFLDHYAPYTVKVVNPPSWSNVADLALWTYVLGKGSDANATSAIRTSTVTAADALVARAASNPYRTTMRTVDYGWGSNGTDANYGLELLVANAIHPDPRYVNAALGNLHYLLGRNAFSLSWVTQVGSNPFHHPHHRPSGADENAEPWPGLLSGGPNRSKQDPAMRKLPDNIPPARMYLDEQAS